MKQEKQSILHRNLNLALVYIVIFLSGLAVVFAMTSVLNDKVKEINDTTYKTIGRNM